MKTFTVEISFKEKVLTSLLFLFLMGAITYSARLIAPPGPTPGIYFNLSFALAVFGIVRLIRVIFQESRRGVSLVNEGMEVSSLFSKALISFPDLRTMTIALNKNPRAELSFRWGQFNYHLPCSNIEALAEALTSHDIPVTFGTLSPVNTAQAPHYRPQRPPPAVLMALVFWSLGTVLMAFTANF